MQNSEFWNGSKSFYPKHCSLFLAIHSERCNPAQTKRKKKKSSASLSIRATSVREHSQREGGGADAFDWKQHTLHLTRASEVTPFHPCCFWMETLWFAWWLWELPEVVVASAVVITSTIISSSSFGFGSSQTCHVPSSWWISASITVVWTRKPQGPPVWNFCVLGAPCPRLPQRFLHTMALAVHISHTCLRGSRFMHMWHTKQASGLSYGLSPSR